MSLANDPTRDTELDATEIGDFQQFVRVADQVTDIWRSNGAAEDGLDRGGLRSPSEIEAGVHLTESQYCAMVVILLWDEVVVDNDELLHLVASNREWLLTARNSGFEVEEVAQFLAVKIATHFAGTAETSRSPTD